MVKNNIELDVKTKCIEQGKTQVQIAEEIDTTKAYVNRVIKKKDGVVNKTFVQMMEALGYDIETDLCKAEKPGGCVTMERHICVWHKENSDNSDEVGWIIIDGNLVEFYSRFHGEVFPSTFIGRDGDHGYKVFVNGSAKHSERKSLDFSSSHRVFYVLMQNYQFSKGIDISGIKEFSFEIPELIKWIGTKTVEFAESDLGTLGAIELDMKPIVLKQADPHIEIRLESKSFNNIYSWKR